MVKNNWCRRWLNLPALANYDPADADGQFLGAANAFHVLVDDWVQVFPFGDVVKDGPVDMRTGARLDKKVLQRFNADSAAHIVANFNDAAARAGARWAGRPWYVGHPDVPGLEKTYPDKKAYGWIMAVEQRADGLYGRVKWSAPGQVMLDNAHYKFHSPFVLGPKIGVERGMEVYLPVWLESVGFTNNPNIRGTVLLVNTRNDGARGDYNKQLPSTENDMNKILMDEFRTLLKLPNTADDNTVVAKLKQTARLGLANSALGDYLNRALQSFNKSVAELAQAAGVDESTVNGLLAGDIQTLPADVLGKVAQFFDKPVEELQKLIPASDPAAVAAENAGLKARLTELQTQFAGERDARIKLELDGLVREGRVTAAEVAFFNSELHAKFDDTLAQLRRRPASFSGASPAGNLGGRKTAADQTPAERFTALVNDALPRFGNDWAAAWAAMKKAHPALVAEMEAKK
ncbi:MAG: phage protease [Verrucomicrobiales bacterium]|nr:phage protease [Verrucomicrobiales bacterium]